MDSQKDKILHQHIDTLINVIQPIIKDAIESKKIGFELEPIRQIEIEGFSYNYKGATFTGAKHGVCHNKNWVRACFFIGEAIFKPDEFLAAELFVEQNYNNPNAKPWFTQYVFHLFNLIFENYQDPDLGAVLEHKKKYIRDIKSEPHEAKAVVYLNGLILESSETKIDDEVLLRQTIKTDLQRPKNSHDEFPFLPIPSAILEITMLLKRDEHARLQEKIEKFVVLFRLFGVGSINYNSYDMTFNTASSPFSQGSMRHDVNYPWKQYLLSKANEAEFLHFVHNLALSPELYKFFKKANYISTAFDI